MRLDQVLECIWELGTKYKVKLAKTLTFPLIKLFLRLKDPLAEVLLGLETIVKHLIECSFHIFRSGFGVYVCILC